MALIKKSLAIESITGPCGGNTFKRDASGRHIVSKPRRVQGCSAAQRRQRNAFSIARAYSTDLRTLSYNIYRALAGLDPSEPPIDFKP